MNTRHSTAAVGLGKQSSRLLTTLAGQGKSIFTTQEAHQILGSSRAATYEPLHDLVQRR
jgi:hypothetical protein